MRESDGNSVPKVIGAKTDQIDILKTAVVLIEHKYLLETNVYIETELRIQIKYKIVACSLT